MLFIIPSGCINLYIIFISIYKYVCITLYHQVYKSQFLWGAKCRKSVLVNFMLQLFVGVWGGGYFPVSLPRVNLSSSFLRRGADIGMVDVGPCCGSNGRGQECGWNSMDRNKVRGRASSTSKNEFAGKFISTPPPEKSCVRPFYFQLDSLQYYGAVFQVKGRLHFNLVQFIIRL